MSTAQAILMETWPREEIGMATALFGMGAVVGPTVGPTIGGYITEHFSWPWIFYVNIPVGVIAAFCVSVFVKESPKYGQGKPIDWWGILFLAVGVGSLQVVLEKGEVGGLVFEDLYHGPDFCDDHLGHLFYLAGD